MGEGFSWPEGACWLWTGAATASAVPTYAENTDASLVYEWENRRNLSGQYYDVLVGQRADVSIGVLHSPNASALRAFAQAATAVHMHLRHGSALGASAGHYFYSGRIDMMRVYGQDGAMTRMRLNLHFNSWSAY